MAEFDYKQRPFVNVSQEMWDNIFATPPANKAALPTATTDPADASAKPLAGSPPFDEHGLLGAWKRGYTDHAPEPVISTPDPTFSQYFEFFMKWLRRGERPRPDIAPEIASCWNCGQPTDSQPCTIHDWDAELDRFEDRAGRIISCPTCHQFLTVNA